MATGGLLVRAKILPAPPVIHAGHPAVRRRQFSDKRTGFQPEPAGHRALQDGGDQAAGNAGSGGVSTGVQDARR